MGQLIIITIIQKSYTFSQRQLALLISGTLLMGIIFSSFHHHLHTPINPIFVDIYNETEEIIPSVVIEHGNLNTQEKIQAIRIEPGEHRIIALNHQTKLGFNIKANFQNGKDTEICAGKWSEERYLRATVSPYGIYMTEIR